MGAFDRHGCIALIVVLAAAGMLVGCGRTRAITANVPVVVVNEQRFGMTRGARPGADLSTQVQDAWMHDGRINIVYTAADDRQPYIVEQRTPSGRLVQSFGDRGQVWSGGMAFARSPDGAGGMIATGSRLNLISDVGRVTKRHVDYSPGRHSKTLTFSPHPSSMAITPVHNVYVTFEPDPYDTKEARTVLDVLSPNLAVRPERTVLLPLWLSYAKIVALENSIVGCSRTTCMRIESPGWTIHPKPHCEFEGAPQVYDSSHVAIIESCGTEYTSPASLVVLDIDDGHADRAVTTARSISSWTRSGEWIYVATSVGDNRKLGMRIRRYRIDGRADSRFGRRGSVFVNARGSNLNVQRLLVDTARKRLWIFAQRTARAPSFGSVPLRGTSVILTVSTT